MSLPKPTTQETSETSTADAEPNSVKQDPKSSPFKLDTPGQGLSDLNNPGNGGGRLPGVE